jgi:putative phosphoesterase
MLDARRTLSRLKPLPQPPPTGMAATQATVFCGSGFSREGGWSAQHGRLVYNAGLLRLRGSPSTVTVTSSRPVRVAIVSDTHGHLCPDVQAVVEGCDVAVHAGDIGSRRVLDLLRSGAGKVVAVRGNNDVPGLWASDELDALDTVPRVAELKLPGGTLIVEHGHVHGHMSPDPGKLRAAHPGARVIVYGHTHRQLIDRTKNPWVVNPGAAGRIRNGGGPSCLVLHAGLDSWEIEAFRFHGSVTHD